MIKNYTFNYGNFEAKVVFSVDTEKFTYTMAEKALEIFIDINDCENNAIEQLLMMYALDVIKIASLDSDNLKYVITEFGLYEGFCKIDGSVGVELKSVSKYRFDEELLTLSLD